MFLHSHKKTMVYLWVLLRLDLATPWGSHPQVALAPSRGTHPTELAIL